MIPGSNVKLNQIEKRLRQIKPRLTDNYKVRQIGIFGSYRRGEQKKNSDVDLLVEFSEPVGLFDFLRLEDFLSEQLGTKVDLVMKDSLKPLLKERIIKEALYI
jgi:predicted nucleotidyltransferase